MNPAFFRGVRKGLGRRPRRPCANSASLQLKTKTEVGFQPAFHRIGQQTLGMHRVAGGGRRDDGGIRGGEIGIQCDLIE